MGGRRDRGRTVWAHPADCAYITNILSGVLMTTYSLLCVDSTAMCVSYDVDRNCPDCRLAILLGSVMLVLLFLTRCPSRGPSRGFFRIPLGMISDTAIRVSGTCGHGAFRLGLHLFLPGH